MSEERVKFEGRLAVNRRERSETQLRLQGLVRSLRDLLDPTKPVESLEGELISAQSLDLANLQIKYRGLLKEAAAIKDILGALMGKKETYFDQAEDLYVVDGFTLEAISARLGKDGPSVTSLSLWKGEGEWDQRRRDWVKSQQDIKRDSLKLRQKLVAQALAIVEGEKPGPQELYAASAIASRLGKTVGSERPEETTEADIDRPALFLEDLEFIVATLKEINPEGLKILARSFEEIISRGKKKYAQTT